MMRYGCHIPSFDRVGDASATLATLLVERFRSMQAGRHRTAMDDWENEGGSVAAATSIESNELAPGKGHSRAAAMGRARP